MPTLMGTKNPPTSILRILQRGQSRKEQSVIPTHRTTPPMEMNMHTTATNTPGTTSQTRSHTIPLTRTPTTTPQTLGQLVPNLAIALHRSHMQDHGNISSKNRTHTRSMMIPTTDLNHFRSQRHGSIRSNNRVRTTGNSNMLPGPLHPALRGTQHTSRSHHASRVRNPSQTQRSCPERSTGFLRLNQITGRRMQDSLILILIRNPNLSNRRIRHTSLSVPHPVPIQNAHILIQNTLTPSPTPIPRPPTTAALPLPTPTQPQTHPQRTVLPTHARKNTTSSSKPSVPHAAAPAVHYSG
jgi:hypothetical protein